MQFQLCSFSMTFHFFKAVDFLLWKPRSTENRAEKDPTVKIVFLVGFFLLGGWQSVFVSKRAEFW